eukprot:CAMPEP_0115732316 /NCGR_PEP_ID=MMETSP0272-20121206/85055_1 /TAXON_ID=71861 /ORGANISM="Scrippsiella trochoidea, Strain CCMP3099" /LENGTH=45 /DNA_ID= /DNA_START= /DNA_END= /DNA_ORIENTATION=
MAPSPEESRPQPAMATSPTIAGAVQQLKHFDRVLPPQSERQWTSP